MCGYSEDLQLRLRLHLPEDEDSWLYLISRLALSTGCIFSMGFAWRLVFWIFELCIWYCVVLCMMEFVRCIGLFLLINSTSNVI
jgi:hypothetical protein